MPSRNIIKVYVKDAYYHIYNRGVAKQDIFLDDLDYKVFLNYLKDALTKPKIKKVVFTLQGQSFKGITKTVKNFQDKIVLISFCLMPNHFHLLIKQNDKNQMENFMRSIVTRYARYFNTKYKRVGHVFQGRYKAVMIISDTVETTGYTRISGLKPLLNDIIPVRKVRGEIKITLIPIVDIITRKIIKPEHCRICHRDI